jgi:hypothetical protein
VLWNPKHCCRDLKPDNILLDDTRTVAKIADFGMARVVTCTPGGKYTDGLVTHWYRPPEIMLGDRRYTSAVDMWSVGVIFLEMMMLWPPFARDSEIACLLLIFERLGTPNEVTYPGITGLPNHLVHFPQWRTPAHLFESFQMDHDIPYYDDAQAMQLAKRLLTIDPRFRISADDCLHNDAYLAQFDSSSSTDSSGDAAAIDEEEESGAEELEEDEEAEAEEEEEEEEDNDREAVEEELKDNKKGKVGEVVGNKTGWWWLGGEVGSKRSHEEGYATSVGAGIGAGGEGGGGGGREEEGGGEGGRSGRGREMDGGDGAPRSSKRSAHVGRTGVGVGFESGSGLGHHL